MSPTSMRWVNFGVEQQLLDETGVILAKLVKSGCCWRATLGAGMNSGRFKDLEYAKQSVERIAKLLNPEPVAHGN